MTHAKSCTNNDPRGALFEPGCKPFMAGEITDDAAGDELIETLENAAWVKDDSSSDKVAYVVYSPSCPWSRKMFNETRDTDLGGQLRWIPVQGDGVAHVAGKRSLDAIETTFKDQDAGNNGSGRGCARPILICYISRNSPIVR